MFLIENRYTQEQLNLWVVASQGITEQPEDQRIEIVVQGFAWAYFLIFNYFII